MQYSYNVTLLTEPNYNYFNYCHVSTVFTKTFTDRMFLEVIIVCLAEETKQVFGI